MDGHFGEPHSLHQGGDGVDYDGTQEKVVFIWFFFFFNDRLYCLSLQKFLLFSPVLIARNQFFHRLDHVCLFEFLLVSFALIINPFTFLFRS